MRTLAIISLVPAIGCCGHSLSAQQREILTPSIKQACTQVISLAMSKRKIPGLSFAVGLNGKMVWTDGFGLADVGNDVKATAATVYRLASISKPITAVAIMQQVEKGTIDLDQPVQTYLPRFPKKRWPLTTRQLLSHLGGVRHYKLGEIFSARRYLSVRSALEIFADDPLLHEPGTKFRYTSYGYNLIGGVLVGATKQRFMRTVQRGVFDPAGMKHAQQDSVQRIIKGRAQGYTRNKLGVLSNSRIVDTSNKIPSGGMCSRAQDLVHFGNALLAGKLIKPRTLDQMWRPTRTNDGKRVNYGLGFAILKSSKPRIVGHSGGQPRVSTMLLIRPDDRVVVAVMCNLEGAGARTIARRIGKIIAER